MLVKIFVLCQLARIMVTLKSFFKKYFFKIFIHHKKCNIFDSTEPTLENCTSLLLTINKKNLATFFSGPSPSAVSSSVPLATDSYI